MKLFFMIYERLYNFIVPLVLYVYLKKKLTLNVKLYNFLDLWDISLM